MSLGVLWRISVITTAEAGDAVAELLFGLCGSAGSIYTDAATRRTTVAVFCERPPADFAAKRALLLEGLHHIKACGLDIGSTRVRVQKLSRQNWAESWKRHFKPIEIGQALLIKPSWSKRLPRAGQAIVVLDPGLSFGTGQHATTEFCLRELVRHRERRQRDRHTGRCAVLDVGTGSGILAIAAAKLGFRPVRAFDFDPEAVRVARDNARANGVESHIEFTRADLTKLPRQLRGSCDVVCANLISTLLITQCRTITGLVNPGGWLALAGILKSEFHGVQTAYESLGLRLVRSKVEKEWRSGLWQRNGAAT